MKLFWVLLLAWLCFFAQARAQEKGIPTFNEFAVTDSFAAPPAKPVLDTPAHRRFRTVIRDGAAMGPNFAGHYTIVHWGCGTSCIQAVVVDAKDGRVVDLPFRFIGAGLPMRYIDGQSEVNSDFERLSFKLKSRLLIVRGCPEYENCAAYYYEWIKPRFRLIRKFAADSLP